MKGLLTVWLIAAALADAVGGALPTVYQHFAAGGVSSGLEAGASGFRLNGRALTVLSGAVHYFRVHPELWRDRLRKLRAMGFIAVETYVPWNLHEPRKDQYDFGDGGDDMSEFLNITRFLQTAQEEDLLAVIRPGPYICAEWEFGGLPSWLLRAKNFEVRTANAEYLERVEKYFDKLFPILAKQQFVNGGPIIAIQIENEYGAMAKSTGDAGKRYLQYIAQLQDRHGLNASLQYTADSPSRSALGRVGNYLMTANFKDNPSGELDTLKKLQPDKPLWVMEYWTGWYDRWMGAHAGMDTGGYASRVEEILRYPASINLYMFHGGTSFGFLNGANVATGFPSVTFDVSSYDYAAPLSEAGDYTEKYNVTSALAAKYNPVQLSTPARPAESTKRAYPATPVSGMLDLGQLLAQVPSGDRVRSPRVLAMETLDINNGSGQSYGYAVYRKTGATVPEGATLKIEGRVHDVGMLLFDGERQTEAFTGVQQTKGFGYYDASDAEFEARQALRNGTLDLLVENWGRVNYGYSTATFRQWKGLWEGDVLLDGAALRDWEIIALQFNKRWVQGLTGWREVARTSGPTLYRASLDVALPADTFLDMSAWGKGVAFVNGFNVGRFFSGGPQRTLYVPAPLLRAGANQIMVFEMYTPAKEIVFSSTPKLS
ncbi:beta-galactosidase-1-like protein 3 [Bacillus rossius redtenbacheri]|uniref:beta-galactosidase-1-like protein 3 n=1 Tax=Bacillus rossius redtenbacheri TaxID=93214 RepID=UPI002FDEFAD5